MSTNNGETKNAETEHSAVTATVTPDNAAALDFLRIWSPEGPWALTAIMPDKGEIQGKLFSKAEFPEMEAWIAKRNGTWNLYFSINPVMGTFKDKAKRENIESVAWLHVDIDAQAPPEGLTADGVAQHVQSELKRIYDLLFDDRPPGVPEPTVVDFSGGGYQAFWKLDEPIPINGNIEKAESAKLYNKQLEILLGGDKCHNIDRIMRLPGTLNIPDAKKIAKGRTRAIARVVKCSPELQYAISEFGKAPIGPAKTASASERTEQRANDETVRHVLDLSDLDQWNVAERVKVIIQKGQHPDEALKKRDTSNSAWLFDTICSLLRSGVPREIVRGIITDPRWQISVSVLNKGSGIRRYANRQIERAEAAISNDPETAALSEMNELHAVIENYGNHTCVMTEDARPYFQSFADFRNRYMHKMVQIGRGSEGKVFSKPLGKWWLEHIERRQFQRVEFSPGGTLPDDFYNLWQGFAVTPKAGNCESFLAFIRTIICGGNEEYGDWVLDWMAHAVQRPQEPGEVAVVLRGGQAIGKSFLAEHFGELFGRHFVPLTDPKHVVGNFNAILHDAQLVFADEAFAAQDRRAEGILKGLVTQSHITIEPKGVDPFKAKRFFRLMLASNNRWVVPADIDDRRFLVLDVSAERKRDHGYFAGLDDEWMAGGREAFMHTLLTRDISKFNHRQRPETRALMEQKLHSLRGARRTIYEMLASGDPPVAKTDGVRIFVATKELHRDSQATCTLTALGRELALAADHREADRETCGNERKRGFWLPRLDEARMNWAREVELSVSWPRDDGQWTTSTAPSVLSDSPI